MGAKGLPERPTVLNLSGMLHRPSWPAQRLQSVALRHRHALARAEARTTARPAFLISPRRDGSSETQRRSRFHRDDKQARLEAVLFVAHEPLSTRKIARFAGLADGTEARTLIRRLNQFYDAEGSAFRVEQFAGGYQLLTRPKFGGWLRRLRPAPVETRLSAPALETLAVVAYRQPVVRAEVESIRGVQCGEMLRQLMERDLVRIAGRSPELGRPFLYATTKRFLQWLGLQTIDELPRAELLRPGSPGTLNASPDKPPAARRIEELTPRNDLNEEPEVKTEMNAESAFEEPWKLTAETLVPPRAAADNENLDVEDEDDFGDDDDDDDDDLDDEEDDDLDDEEDDDLDDDDLEDDEWEEVDDDDDWDEDDEDDWEDDDEDEDDEDDDWEDD